MDDSDSDTEGDLFEDTSFTSLQSVVSSEQQVLKGVQCLSQRIISEVVVRNKDDLHEVEDIIRVFLKGDFGNCAALQACPYTSFRIEMLRHIRKKQWENHDQQCDEKQDRKFIAISNTLYLSANMQSLSVFVIERPHQQSIR